MPQSRLHRFHRPCRGIQALSGAQRLKPFSAAKSYINENNYGISIAASRLAIEALSARDAEPYDRDSRLSDRLIARAQTASEQIIDEAITCLAEPIAQRFSIPELLAFKAFFATNEGKAFWMYHVRFEPWEFCFNGPVRKYLADYVEQDLAAVMAETPIK